MEAKLKKGPGSRALEDQALESSTLKTQPLSPSLHWTPPTCEHMVLPVAVDMGLQARSGSRGSVNATVGTGKQAAPSDSVDTLTPK